MQSEDNRNMLTLKLTQEFGGFLKGLTMSVQAMTEHIGYFSEYRRIWPDLYRATGRTAQGVLIKSAALSTIKYGIRKWRKLLQAILYGGESQLEPVVRRPYLWRVARILYER